MHLALTPHPDTPARAVSAVEVEVGPVSAGQAAAALCRDGWDRRTGAAGGGGAGARRMSFGNGRVLRRSRRAAAGGYREFNFSPSTQWAAYDFDGYRAGMRNADVLAPRIEGRHGQKHYELHVAFDLPGDGPWRVALTAVIEETGGVKSYWALKHAPGKPDFHHADGFVLELP